MIPETQLKPKNDVLKGIPQIVKPKAACVSKPVTSPNRVKFLEKENAELRKLIRSAKESTLVKSRSVSVASHDCRSPLTCIQLSASLIERYYDRLDKKRLFSNLGKIKLAVMELTEKLDMLEEI